MAFWILALKYTTFPWQSFFSYSISLFLPSHAWETKLHISHATRKGLDQMVTILLTKEKKWWQSWEIMCLKEMMIWISVSNIKLFIAVSSHFIGCYVVNCSALPDGLFSVLMSLSPLQCMVPITRGLPSWQVLFLASCLVRRRMGSWQCPVVIQGAGRVGMLVWAFISKYLPWVIS